MSLLHTLEELGYGFLAIFRLSQHALYGVWGETTTRDINRHGISPELSPACFRLLVAEHYCRSLHVFKRPDKANEHAMIALCTSLMATSAEQGPARRLRQRIPEAWNSVSSACPVTNLRAPDIAESAPRRRLECIPGRSRSPDYIHNN